MAAILKQVPKFREECHFNSAWSTVPKQVPSTAEDIVAADCYLTEIDLTTVSGVTASITVTVADKATSPVEVAVLLVIPGSAAPMRFGARYCPGGATWVASAADSVTGHIRFLK